jgi:histidinol-phosphatase (PHP family)
MPSKEILIRYRELKGELISFASDAHKAEQVAGGYDKVAEFLKSLGYKYVTGFVKHKAVMYEI